MKTFVWSCHQSKEYLFAFSDAKVIRLNVYRLRDSSLGFYHTGLEYENKEYTYCCGIGICYHKPKRCHFAVHLGTKTLGYVDIDPESFQTILKGIMNHTLIAILNVVPFHVSIHCNYYFHLTMKVHNRLQLWRHDTQNKNLPYPNSISNSYSIIYIKLCLITWIICIFRYASIWRFCHWRLWCDGKILQ